MCTQERTRLICGWMSHQAIRLISARLARGIRSSLCFQRQSSTDEAPSFTDDTGDDQDWTQNDAITDILVPTASGAPAPTYAVQGSLPAGIAFNTTTRVISGTPTAVGSGTITIRATNSEGNADWTVDYTTTAPPVDLMPTLPSDRRPISNGEHSLHIHPPYRVRWRHAARL